MARLVIPRFLVQSGQCEQLRSRIVSQILAPSLFNEGRTLEPRSAGAPPRLAARIAALILDVRPAIADFVVMPWSIRFGWPQADEATEYEAGVVMHGDQCPGAQVRRCGGDQR